jgi:hypothetical protein
MNIITIALKVFTKVLLRVRLEMLVGLAVVARLQLPTRYGAGHAHAAT